ncbi:MAG: translation initiation factor Sui1 [Candidatus Latescibacteria bacterium]|nr:translation initiation factor Sui1 [Candidatus Latescibacterota bacterium]
MQKNRNSALVYSTDTGRVCADCGRSAGRCTCRKKKGKVQQSNAPPNDGVVRVARQTKGRKGKGVTLITGIPLEGTELKDLSRQLKQQCGTGGTIKDGVVEIQGDHRDLLVDELKKRGWTVKKAGG